MYSPESLTHTIQTTRYGREYSAIQIIYKVVIFGRKDTQDSFFYSNTEKKSSSISVVWRGNYSQTEEPATTSQAFGPTEGFLYDRLWDWACEFPESHCTSSACLAYSICPIHRDWQSHNVPPFADSFSVWFPQATPTGVLRYEYCPNVTCELVTSGRHSGSRCLTLFFRMTSHWCLWTFQMQCVATVYFQWTICYQYRLRQHHIMFSCYEHMGSDKPRNKSNTFVS
jgi:hypothetical protein